MIIEQIGYGASFQEAYEKAKGTYGRFAEAVKYVDPRLE